MIFNSKIQVAKIRKLRIRTEFTISSPMVFHKKADTQHRQHNEHDEQHKHNGEGQEGSQNGTQPAVTAHLLKRDNSEE